MLISILYVLANIIPLLVAIAYFTLLERKVIAAIQRRKGPNIVGVWGLLQPVSDGLKLLTQEQFFPKNSKKFFFLVAPCLVFFFSLSYWAVIPTSRGSLVCPEFGILAVHTISSLSVYGVFLAGISSSSKYAIIGALRTVAQFVSYELCSGICILFVVLLGQSLSFSDVVLMQKHCGWFGLVGFPFFVGYFICVLAETNRTPFDLGEAEAELVAGFHLEYSATGFALFFLGEYCTILAFCTVMSLLFLGGWNLPFIGFGKMQQFFVIRILSHFILFSKATVLCVAIIVIRAYEPRFRYDQLMSLCWKIMMPLLFGIFFIVAELFFFQDGWKWLFAIGFVGLELLFIEVYQKKTL
jgi:NADH-quinone oxidoreductase subunit H